VGDFEVAAGEEQFSRSYENRSEIGCWFRLRGKRFIDAGSLATSDLPSCPMERSPESCLYDYAPLGERRTEFHFVTEI
jgi:hypothetical protein